MHRWSPRTRGDRLAKHWRALRSAGIETDVCTLTVQSLGKTASNKHSRKRVVDCAAWHSEVQSLLFMSRVLINQDTFATYMQMNGLLCKKTLEHQRERRLVRRRASL